jgi:hypothetical protein
MQNPEFIERMPDETGEQVLAGFQESECVSGGFASLMHKRGNADSNARISNTMSASCSTADCIPYKNEQWIPSLRTLERKGGHTASLLVARHRFNGKYVRQSGVFVRRQNNVCDHTDSRGMQPFNADRTRRPVQIVGSAYTSTRLRLVQYRAILSGTG